MALLNTKNYYIKLSEDGSYEVWASKEARDKVKNSTPSEYILAKYKELISNLEAQEDFAYYDKETFFNQYISLLNEYDRYQYNLNHYIVDQDYPIMSEYYIDVCNTIPEIIESARILSDEAINLEAAYKKAKEVKRFGETTDA